MSFLSKEIVEKRDELKRLEAAIDAAWKTVGPEIDLDRLQRFGDEDWSSLSSGEKSVRLEAATTRMKRLRDQVLDGVEKHKQRNGGNGWMIHPTPGDAGQPAQKTLDELMAGDQEVKAWLTSGKANSIVREYDARPSEVLGFGRKVLFQTTAGWAPESLRIPRVIEAATRPIGVLDLIPVYPTGSASVVYMEETTRTHNAAEKAEGLAYAESEFALTERSSTVRKITDSIPVTDEQLDDVSMAESYLRSRLMFGVRQKLDGQVLNGNGIAPNLLGILNVPGIQTQPKGADPVPDAIYKAMVLVQTIGRANPNGIVMHPNDWQDIRLLRTTDGVYIWGPPSQTGNLNIFGLQVVVTDAIAENTALVGDFANFCGLFERLGVRVEMGYVNDDFSKGKKTLRCTGRFGFVVFRPSAFATITGI